MDTAYFICFDKCNTYVVSLMGRRTKGFWKHDLRKF